MGNSPPVFRPFHKMRAQNRPEIRLSSQNKYMEDLTMKQLQHGSLFLLAALLLTLPVFADSGPKPMIYVWVENGPEEPYYMDLLEEDPYTPYSFGPDQSVWGYSEEYEAGLDQDLMDGLLAAVPEGWHSCSLQGTRGGLMYADLDGSRSREEGLHRFVSHGVPETFRVLAVTKSGQIFCSEPLTRRAYQVSVTLDWSAGTVSMPPVWQRYVLQFLATFVPTILIEGVFLWLLGLWSRRNVLVFLLVNLLTQGGLSLWFSIEATRYAIGYWYFWTLIPAEIAVLAVEIILYRRFLQEPSNGRAVTYAVTANLASAILGFFLAEPVWTFMVVHF